MPSSGPWAFSWTEDLHSGLIPCVTLAASAWVQEGASSVPSVSTGWVANVGAYLWQLSVAVADMLIENPGKTTGICGSPISLHPPYRHSSISPYSSVLRTLLQVTSSITITISHSITIAVAGLYQPVQSSVSQWRVLKLPLGSKYSFADIYVFD